MRDKSDDIKPQLLSHMEKMIQDARDYDWQQEVLPWSEEVFTLISAGLLTWDLVEKIQMLRMTLAVQPASRHCPLRKPQHEPGPRTNRALSAS